MANRYGIPSRPGRNLQRRHGHHPGRSTTTLNFSPWSSTRASGWSTASSSWKSWSWPTPSPSTNPRAAVPCGDHPHAQRPADAHDPKSDLHRRHPPPSAWWVPRYLPPWPGNSMAEALHRAAAADFEELYALEEEE